ncbi:flagellar hook-length control protein FliK [Craterilacuibacter sp.]|uniref:flagellar hook-length control protein FliK n=1 Tax=Craterilacuibacter sp. TaxID=2870909 RepID=UPI003F40A40C
MTINPLALQAPGRQSAFSLPSAGEVAAPADLFASLLGLQMGTKLAAKPVLEGIDPDSKPLKPQKGEQADVALFLYGAAPAALPVHAVSPQVPDSTAAGGVDEVLDLTQEMLAATQVAGGKKLPHEERQLLQFLPDGSLVAQTVRAADAGQASPQISLAVNTPLASGKAWGEELSGQVAGLIQMKAEGATIKLNPAHLGPIEVSLKMSQDQAQISFVAATPQARDALEQNLSRLASMLAESGVQLTDAQVSYGGRQQQQEQQQARRHPDLGDEEVVVSVGSLSDDASDAGLSIRA